MRRVLHSSSLDIRHQLFHARQVRHSCEERRSDEVPPRDRRARATSGPDFGADLAPTNTRYFWGGNQRKDIIIRKQHRTRDFPQEPAVLSFAISGSSALFWGETSSVQTSAPNTARQTDDLHRGLRAVSLRRTRTLPVSVLHLTTSPVVRWR